jgi:hypothetical protein
MMVKGFACVAGLDAAASMIALLFFQSQLAQSYFFPPKVTPTLPKQ